MNDLDILSESELNTLASSSGDDVDMALVQCVVREVRDLRNKVAKLECVIGADISIAKGAAVERGESDTVKAIAAWLDTLGPVGRGFSADIRAGAWKADAATPQHPTRRAEERSELPCPDCHEHHLLDQFQPGMRVSVDGRRGTVLEWSQYGSPLYVRIEFDNRDDHGNPFRDNFNPCEIRAETRPT